MGCGGAFAQTAPERVGITGQRAQGTALTQPSTAGSRLGLAPLDTAATVSVLDGERVRERGLSSLIDAKTLAPGISSAPNPGNGDNLLSARGFSTTNPSARAISSPPPANAFSAGACARITGSTSGQADPATATAVE